MDTMWYGCPREGQTVCDDSVCKYHRLLLPLNIGSQVPNYSINTKTLPYATLILLWLTMDGLGVVTVVSSDMPKFKTLGVKYLIIVQAQKSYHMPL